MTPGQAAFEAFYTSFGGTVPDWPPIGPDGALEAWEAAARAVIETFAQQPAPLVVNVSGKLTEADVARLRKRFAEVARTGRPRVIE